jgi:hypothetical protein
MTDEDIEGERTRGTYSLDGVESVTSQATKGSDLARGTHGLERTKGGTKSGYVKVSQHARSTHKLESDEGETGQDTERKRVSERAALTLWRAQTERQVRIWKGGERTSDTHSLPSVGGTCQYAERI